MSEGLGAQNEDSNWQRPHTYVKRCLVSKAIKNVSQHFEAATKQSQIAFCRWRVIAFKNGLTDIWFLLGKDFTIKKKKGKCSWGFYTLQVKRFGKPFNSLKIPILKVKDTISITTVYLLLFW